MKNTVLLFLIASILSGCNGKPSDSLVENTIRSMFGEAKTKIEIKSMDKNPVENNTCGVTFSTRITILETGDVTVPLIKKKLTFDKGEVYDLDSAVFIYIKSNEEWKHIFIHSPYPYEKLKLIADATGPFPR